MDLFNSNPFNYPMISCTKFYYERFDLGQLGHKICTFDHFVTNLKQEITFKNFLFIHAKIR
jgi:hypothetical protein